MQFQHGCVNNAASHILTSLKSIRFKTLFESLKIEQKGSPLQRNRQTLFAVVIRWVFVCGLQLRQRRIFRYRILQPAYLL
jgi:hypothetical protein